MGNHNARLAFTGRRVLRASLAMFLYSITSSHSTGLAAFDEAWLSDDKISVPLDAIELGKGLGKEWQLEEIMRWREVQDLQGKGSGLYKLRGEAVQSLVGAAYGYYVRLFFQLVISC